MQIRVLAAKRSGMAHLDFSPTPCWYCWRTLQTKNLLALLDWI